MNITISEQTKAYLKKKNLSCLTLSLVSGGGGCCGVVAMPSVRYEAPSDLNQYMHYLVDDINVYIHKLAIEEDSQLKFILRKYFSHEYVDVEGYKIL